MDELMHNIYSKHNVHIRCEVWTIYARKMLYKSLLLLLYSVFPIYKYFYTD